jgi:dihydrofolate synthase/folylpolyglutamate synthase
MRHADAAYLIISNASIVTNKDYLAGIPHLLKKKNKLPGGTDRMRQNVGKKYPIGRLEVGTKETVCAPAAVSVLSCWRPTDKTLWGKYRVNGIHRRFLKKSAQRSPNGIKLGSRPGLAFPPVPGYGPPMRHSPPTFSRSGRSPAARSFFPDFAALDVWLNGLGLFRMRPGLERMRSVLGSLSLTRPPCAVVQVAGTNGKGSTSVMLASLGLEYGLTVGLHTSPHFLSVRERVRVNGEMLSEATWASLGNTIVAHGGSCLSYFEFVTCLAILAFAEAGADLAVMETGLGGRFDATTALEADLVLFTPIGLDHQAVLGRTLPEIARDKAGAIRQGRPVVTAPQRPEAMREIERAAGGRNARLVEAASEKHLREEEKQEDSLSPGLAGEHQKINARLALTAWRVLREGTLFGRTRTGAAQDFAPQDSAPECREKAALAKAWLPGRMQFVPHLPSPAPVEKNACPGLPSAAPCPEGWPPLLLDGAHNSHGLAALGRSLARAGIAPAAVIFSCLADKHPAEMAPHLRVLAAGPIFVPPISGNPRAMSPKVLAALIGLNAVPAASFTEALKRAAGHMAGRVPEAFTDAADRVPLLICGSLYLLSDFYALRPDCLERPGTGTGRNGAGGK